MDVFLPFSVRMNERVKQKSSSSFEKKCIRSQKGEKTLKQIVQKKWLIKKWFIFPLKNKCTEFGCNMACTVSMQTRKRSLMHEHVVTDFSFVCCFFFSLAEIHSAHCLHVFCTVLGASLPSTDYTQLNSATALPFCVWFSRERCTTVWNSDAIIKWTRKKSRRQKRNFFSSSLIRHSVNIWLLSLYGACNGSC